MLALVLAVAIVPALLTSARPALASGNSSSAYLGSFTVRAPLSVATDGKSRIFIGGRGGRITVTDPDGVELASMGGPGSALEGIIYEPSDMVYYEGRLYIADSWYSHIVVLTPEGEVLAVHGRSGRGPKEFNEPLGLAVSGGLIYVADTGNARVQVLGPDGVFLDQFGIEGGTPEKLRLPVSVAVNNMGMAYVVDAIDGWVKLYDVSGKYVGNIKQLRQPRDVILTASTTVVSDASDGVIRVFSGVGNPLGMTGPWGKGASPFVDISGFTVMGDRLYAGDLEGNEVKILGFPLREGESAGSVSAPRPYASVIDVSVHKGLLPGKLHRGPDGRLYVLDLRSSLILRLEGGLGAVPVGPEGCIPVSFTVGAGGEIYCLDTEKDLVVISDSGGSVMGQIVLSSEEGASGRLVDIAVSEGGNVLIADRGLGAVHVYGPDGDYQGRLGIGGTSFYIRDPVALRVDDKGMVYVADAASRVVYIYSVSGRLVRRRWDSDVRVSPGGIAVSPGRIYVLDRDMTDIKIFSTGGRLLMSFGSRGEGRGEMSGPGSIEVDAGGALVVSDTGNSRLQKFGLHIDQQHEKILRRVIVPATSPPGL